ncbi:GFA family protein [Paraglaciecola arctica]
MTDHFGTCLCGTAKFQVQGEFESFYLCHCQRCRVLRSQFCSSFP